MTWLGKILTTLVFVGALVWAYFNVQTYVTRANWKVESDKYKDAFQKSEAARKAEYARNQSSEDALRRQIVNEQKRGDDLSAQVTTLTTNAKTAAAEFAQQQEALEKNDIKAIL